MPTFRLVSFLSRLWGNLPHRGQVLWCVVLADPALVFPEGHAKVQCSEFSMLQWLRTAESNFPAGASRLLM